MKNLGKQGTDMITGFTGVITQKIYHVTGCVQYGLRGAAIDNVIPRIHTFDESRVIVGDIVFQSKQEGGE